MKSSIATPHYRKRLWPYPLIWIIPIATAIGAGLYLRDYLSNHGPEITIEFNDASGLRDGETRLLHRGAEIGKVTAIELTEDHKHAIVHAQLLKREDSFATKGATFWIVRPEVSEAGLSGLGTLFSGPYINSLPGKDEETLNVFTGMSKPPRPYEEGEHFILTTPKLGHVQDGSSVYYKGVPVGSVQEVELANEADHLDVHVVVWSRYAALVRENSKFWVVSGFDFKGGLFSGAELRLDSLKTVVSGGIAFGTPEKEVKAQAKTGFHFVLEDSPQKDWEAWSPRISISPKSGDTASKPIELPTRKLERKK